MDKKQKLTDPKVFRFPVGMWKKLQHYAVENNTTVTGIIRKLVSNFLKDDKKCQKK